MKDLSKQKRNAAWLIATTAKSQKDIASECGLSYGSLRQFLLTTEFQVLIDEAKKSYFQQNNECPHCSLLKPFITELNVLINKYSALSRKLIRR